MDSDRFFDWALGAIVAVGGLSFLIVALAAFAAWQERRAQRRRQRAIADATLAEHLGLHSSIVRGTADKDPRRN